MYKLWLRSSKEPVLSRHVKILENKFPSKDWYGICDEGETATADAGAEEATRTV